MKIISSSHSDQRTRSRSRELNLLTANAQAILVCTSLVHSTNPSPMFISFRLAHRWEFSIVNSSNLQDILHLDENVPWKNRFSGQMNKNKHIYFFQFCFQLYTNKRSHISNKNNNNKEKDPYVHVACEQKAQTKRERKWTNDNWINNWLDTRTMLI